MAASEPDRDSSSNPRPKTPEKKPTVLMNGAVVLLVIMLLLSLMMVSEVKYPTFKKLDFKATRTFTKTLIAILCIGAVLILKEKILYWALPLFFTSYLIYGFIRPHVSRKVRYEIADDDDDDEPSSAS